MPTRNPSRAVGSGVCLAEKVVMKLNPTPDRRIHPSGREQFESARADLEARLRRIYGSEWPQGFDELIARLVRVRVREAHGLVRPT